MFLKLPKRLSTITAAIFLVIMVVSLVVGGFSLYLVGKIYRDSLYVVEQSDHFRKLHYIASSIYSLSSHLLNFVETREPYLQESFLTQRVHLKGLLDSFINEEHGRGKIGDQEIEHISQITGALARLDSVANALFISSPRDAANRASFRNELKEVMGQVTLAVGNVEALHRAQSRGAVQAVERKMEIIGGLYVMVGLIGVGLIFAFHPVIIRWVVKPIERMAQASLDIARGKFGLQLERDGVAEIGQLEENFNRMSAVLKEYRDRVEGFSEELENEVQRRTEALEAVSRELQESQFQISQAERLAVLGEIAAEVVHEINNPLDGIKDCAQILAESGDEMTPEQRQKYAHLMREGMRRVERVMKELLDFAREPTRLNRRSLDLNRSVEKALSLMRYKTGRSGIAVESELAPELKRVWADPHAIQQLLVNLIINALDAMEGERGTLKLTTRDLDEETVELVVTDTGCGIPPENLKRIFHPLFTTKRPSKGTGLGLGICSKIVKGHGGSIMVESEAGKGTSFFVHLPAASPGET